MGEWIISHRTKDILHGAEDELRNLKAWGKKLLCRLVVRPGNSAFWTYSCFWAFFSSVEMWDDHDLYDAYSQEPKTVLFWDVLDPCHISLVLVSVVLGVSILIFIQIGIIIIHYL